MGKWVSVHERRPDKKDMPRWGWLVFAPRRMQPPFFTRDDPATWSGLSYGICMWWDGPEPVSDPPAWTGAHA